MAGRRQYGRRDRRQNYFAAKYRHRHRRLRTARPRRCLPALGHALCDCVCDYCGHYRVLLHRIRTVIPWHQKQPALWISGVQAAFDRERASENYFSDGFDITGDMRISLGHDPSCVCCRLNYGMVWNNSVTTKPRASGDASYILLQEFAYEVRISLFHFLPF